MRLTCLWPGYFLTWFFLSEGKKIENLIFLGDIFKPKPKRKMVDPSRATKNKPDPTWIKTFWPGPITTSTHIVHLRIWAKFAACSLPLKTIVHVTVDFVAHVLAKLNFIINNNVFSKINLLDIKFFKLGTKTLIYMDLDLVIDRFQGQVYLSDPRFQRPSKHLAVRKRPSNSCTTSLNKKHLVLLPEIEQMSFWFLIQRIFVKCQRHDYKSF